VRLAAAYNGVFALKPSMGRVAMYPSVAFPVPMTRKVADAVSLMTVLTRPDPPRLHGAAASGYRLAAGNLKRKWIGLVQDNVTPVMPFPMEGDEIVIVYIRHAARRWPWEEEQTGVFQPAKSSTRHCEEAKPTTQSRVHGTDSGLLPLIDFNLSGETGS
jgi:hypothetical protein